MKPDLLVARSVLHPPYFKRLSNNTGEPRGCHCIGRSFQDSIDQLAQLMCSDNAPPARDSGSHSEQLIA
jgi:hypothetical protein